MRYRGEGSGRREEAGRVIRREVPVELAQPPAPAPRRRPWRQFAVGWVVVVTVGLLIGQYTLSHQPPADHPRPLPEPVNGSWPGWMNKACGNFAPAISADLLGGDGPQPLVLVYCQEGITQQVAEP